MHLDVVAVVEADTDESKSCNAKSNLKSSYVRLVIAKTLLLFLSDRYSVH